MLIIKLSRKSRRGINTATIRGAVARVLADSDVVGRIISPHHLDTERLVVVTVEVGARQNTVTVTQSAPLNGQWFDRGNDRRNRFERAVVGAINDGLDSMLRRDKFLFTVDQSGSEYVPVPAPSADQRPARRGSSNYHDSPSATP